MEKKRKKIVELGLLVRGMGVVVGNKEYKNCWAAS